MKIEALLPLDRPCRAEWLAKMMVTAWAEAGFRRADAISRADKLKWRDKRVHVL